MNVVINLGVAADLNTLKNVGVYQVQNPVNGPSAGLFFVQVTSTNVQGANTAVQKAWDLDTGTEYRRLKSNTGWKNWVTVGGGGGGGGDYDPLGTADAVMADHLAATDPHPQYLNNDRGDVRYDANGAAATAVSNHVAASDPHTQYLTEARGDVLYDPIGTADAAIAAHEADTDPHTQYFNQARGDARYDKTGANYRDFAEITTPASPGVDVLRIYAVDEGGVTRLLQKNSAGVSEYVGTIAATTAVSTHVAESDPHPQYLNTTRSDARNDARYDPISAASTAVSNHVAASDPHVQYHNNTRGDARYDALGAAAAAIAAHLAAADPHTQYHNDARGDARYAPISVTGKAPTIRILTTSGNFVPSSGAIAALFIGTGGGGSGGGVACTVGNASVGGSGGGGGTFFKLLSLVGVSSIPYTIGAGGVHPTAGANSGNVGGDTMLGTSGVYGIGYGGKAGSLGSNTSAQGAPSATSGDGGLAANGDFNLAGVPGGVGLKGPSSAAISGPGGASFWGGGGTPKSSFGNVQNGNDGTAYGSGSSGASGTNANGSATSGDAAPGVIWVMEFYA